MKFYTKKWMKSVLALSLLSGATLLQADLVVQEQILATTGFGGNDEKTGGYGVEIDGDWAFVGNSIGCQVAVFKYNYLTNLWDNGAGDTTKAYVDLVNGGGACTAAGIGGFGKSISSSNGLVVVGAPDAKDGGSERYGKIHFFTYDDAQKSCDTDTCRKGWVLRTTIGWPQDRDANNNIVDDKQPNADYGTSVSVEYNSATGIAILAIGAPGYDSTTNGADTGKVYVYEWDNANGTATLINGEEGQNAGDRVGTAITSNGDELIAGAPGYGANDTGAVYLFDYNTADYTFTLEHRLESGVGIIPALANGFHMGASLSYLDTTIILGGADALVLEHNHPAGILNFKQTISNTNEGDVSQSGSFVDIARKGTASVAGQTRIWFDKTNIDPSNPQFSYLKSEEDYGRDVSLSLPRLMVNGNYANGTGSNDQGVAYAYYPTCGVGGQLQAGVWQVIGLQCDAYQAGGTTKATIADIFDPSLGTYDTDWVMYARKAPNYDGRSNSYVKLVPTDTLEVGVGYWIVSMQDGAFAVNTPLEGHTIPKINDPLVPARATIGATTNKDIKAMMMANGTPYGRDGVGSTSDFRVLFANPLTIPTLWSEAVIGRNTTHFTVDSYNSVFEDSQPTAFTYNPAMNWWTAISGVPGLSNIIAPGQGFSVKMSNSYFTDVLTNSGVTTSTLNLAEQKY